MKVVRLKPAYPHINIFITTKTLMVLIQHIKISFIHVQEGIIMDAQEIFDRYKKSYNNEMQGLCLIIADETQKAIGGDIVAGYLCMCGIQRPHWWVEKNGIIYDFMGDVYKKEINFHRKEEHRNREIFESLLPRYEHYRL